MFASSLAISFGYLLVVRKEKREGEYLPILSPIQVLCCMTPERGKLGFRHIHGLSGDIITD